MDCFTNNGDSTFFSITHGTCTKIDHDHRRLKKSQPMHFKKIHVKQASSLTTCWLKISNKKNTLQYIWKFKNPFMNLSRNHRGNDKKSCNPTAMEILILSNRWEEYLEEN